MDPENDAPELDNTDREAAGESYLRPDDINVPKDSGDVWDERGHHRVSRYDEGDVLLEPPHRVTVDPDDDKKTEDLPDSGRDQGTKRHPPAGYGTFQSPEEDESPLDAPPDDDDEDALDSGDVFDER